MKCVCLQVEIIIIIIKTTTKTMPVLEVLGRPAPDPQGSDVGAEFAQGSLAFMAGRDAGAAQGSGGTDGRGAEPGKRGE